MYIPSYFCNRAVGKKSADGIPHMGKLLARILATSRQHALVVCKVPGTKNDWETFLSAETYYEDRKLSSKAISAHEQLLFPFKAYTGLLWAQNKVFVVLCWK